MERYICIHGHFYQPPRENAWLEYVELQDSAYPFHDWNERITAECYAPNGMSRIIDGDSQILKITNNYARISFNFGPTLLAWLKQKERASCAAAHGATRVAAVWILQCLMSFACRPEDASRSFFMTARFRRPLPSNVCSSEARTWLAV